MCTQMIAKDKRLNHYTQKTGSVPEFRNHPPLIDLQSRSKQPGYEQAVMERAKELALEAKGRGAWVPDVERIALNLKKFDAYVEKLFSGNGEVPDRSGWI